MVSLLPAKQPRISIWQDEHRIIGGLPPSLVVPYRPIEHEGTFQVRADSDTIGTFHIAKKKAPSSPYSPSTSSFYTLVILEKQKGRPSIVFTEDTVTKNDDEAAPPQKRFRGYFGGYDFSYVVDAGKLGRWEVKPNTGMFVDIPITNDADAPRLVGITYTANDGTQATMRDTTNYGKKPHYSAFARLEGVKRVGIITYADNITPSPPVNEESTETAEE